MTLAEIILQQSLRESIALLRASADRIEELERENRRLRKFRKRYQVSLSAFHKGEGVPNGVPNPLPYGDTPSYNRLALMQANQKRSIEILQANSRSAPPCNVGGCAARNLRSINWIEASPK